MPKRLPPQRIDVFFHEHQDGDISMTIQVHNIRLRPNGDCSQYELIDVFKSLNCKVNCDGISRNPKMLLKVYCKIGNHNTRALHNRALANVRNGVVPLH